MVSIEGQGLTDGLSVPDLSGDVCEIMLDEAKLEQKDSPTEHSVTVQEAGAVLQAMAVTVEEDRLHREMTFDEQVVLIQELKQQVRKEHILTTKQHSALKELSSMLTSMRLEKEAYDIEKEVSHH